MHGNSILAHPTRRFATRALVMLITAGTLTACADDSPVEPRANMPEGGVKTALLGINILPTGQQFPARIGFVTGSARGQAPTIQVYDRYGQQMARFKAFTDTWDQAGPGVEVAIGDVNGDGWPDILAGEGPTPFSPSGSRFSVWNGRTGAYIGGFATSTTHRGGLRVGAADLNGDGRDEILACYGPSTHATRVDVLTLNATGTNIGYLRPSTTLGWLTGTDSYNGCRVAGGDVTGDHRDEMVVVFEGPLNTLWVHNPIGNSILRSKPLGNTYTGAISVAVGDAGGDGKAEVFLGRMASTDANPPVLIFDGAKLMSSNNLPNPAITYPYTGSTSNTGIYIAAHNLNGDAFTELLAKPTTTG